MTTSTIEEQELHALFDRTFPHPEDGPDVFRYLGTLLSLDETPNRADLEREARRRGLALGREMGLLVKRIDLIGPLPNPVFGDPDAPEPYGRVRWLAQWRAVAALLEDDAE